MFTRKEVNRVRKGVEVRELSILTSQKAIINGEMNPPKERL